jgi:hypothetical protein
MGKSGNLTSRILKLNKSDSPPRERLMNPTEQSPKPGEWKRVKYFGSAGNRAIIPGLCSLKPVPIPTEISQFLLQAKHRENLCSL